MSPMTKFWLIQLKPGVEVNSPQFQSTWRNLLDFCNNQSGRSSAGHSVWQDTSDPNNLVFISGYPSQESSEAADAKYLEGHMKAVTELVESKGIIQIGLDIEVLPLYAQFVGLELFSVPTGVGHDIFEGQIARSVQTLAVESGVTGYVGGWDVWNDILRLKKGLGQDVELERTYANLTGWTDALSWASASEAPKVEQKLKLSLCISKILD